MYKYFDRKPYDTDKADKLAEWDNGFHRGDSQWVDETLMRTKDGRWFLYGEGGYRTRYARRAGLNCWYPTGEAIIPFDAEAARDWAEEHLDGDDVDRIFGL